MKRSDIRPSMSYRCLDTVTSRHILFQINRTTQGTARHSMLSHKIKSDHIMPYLVSPLRCSGVLGFAPQEGPEVVCLLALRYVHHSALTLQRAGERRREEVEERSDGGNMSTNRDEVAWGVLDTHNAGQDKPGQVGSGSVATRGCRHEKAWTRHTQSRSCLLLTDIVVVSC